MLTKFYQESFLPCELEEIYFEAYVDDKPSFVHEGSKFIVLNKSISIIECTDGYIVDGGNDIFYTPIKKIQ